MNNLYVQKTIDEINNLLIENNLHIIRDVNDLENQDINKLKICMIYDPSNTNNKVGINGGYQDAVIEGIEREQRK